MSNYLAVPMMIDRHTAGLRGTHLKIAHTEYDLIAMDAASFLTTLFRADKNCGNDQELSKKIVILDVSISADCSEARELPIIWT